MQFNFWGGDIFMLNMTTLWTQIASEAVFGIWFRVFCTLSESVWIHRCSIIPHEI